LHLKYIGTQANYRSCKIYFIGSRTFYISWKEYR